MYILADIKLIVENQDLYIGTKTTFDFFKYKKFLLFNVKDFRFN